MDTVTLLVPSVEEEQAQVVLRHAQETAGLPTRGVVVPDPQRSGYTATVNRGLSQVESGHACVVVDDCEFRTEAWLLRLLEVLAWRDDVGFVGPSGPCRTRPQCTGQEDDPRPPQLVSHVAGFCLLVRDEVLSRVGPLDDRYQHYGVDVDWQWRGRALGYRTAWAPGVYVWRPMHKPREPWWSLDNKTFEQIWK
jgi:hypothetical protein